MKYASDILSEALYQARQSKLIQESTEGVTGDSSDLSVYDDVSEVNEKTIKGKETGRYATKKHVGEVSKFDLWTAEDLNTGNQVLLIVDKDNPKVHIPIDAASAAELPQLVKKATRFFGGDGVIQNDVK